MSYIYICTEPVYKYLLYTAIFSFFYHNIAPRIGVININLLRSVRKCKVPDYVDIEQKFCMRLSSLLGYAHNVEPLSLIQSLSVLSVSLVLVLLQLSGARDTNAKRIRIRAPIACTDNSPLFPILASLGIREHAFERVLWSKPYTGLRSLFF